MSSVLEIVELVDGEVVLRRADSESEPLLRLQFSEEAQLYIGGAQVEVARAMIQAGIEAVSDVQLQEIEAAREKLDLEREGSHFSDLQNEEDNQQANAAVVSADSDDKPDVAHSEESSSEPHNELTLEKRSDQTPTQSAQSKPSGIHKRELGSIKASDLSSRRVLH